MRLWFNSTFTNVLAYPPSAATWHLPDSTHSCSSSPSIRDFPSGFTLLGHWPRRLLFINQYNNTNTEGHPHHESKRKEPGFIGGCGGRGREGGKEKEEEEKRERRKRGRGGGREEAGARKRGKGNDARYFSSFYEISVPLRFCFLGQNEAQMMNVVLWIWPPLCDFRGGGSHRRAPPPRVSLSEEDRSAELTGQQEEGVQFFISGIASLYDIK